jgi:high-affinity iron transporter
MRRPIFSGTVVGIVCSLVTAYGLMLLFRGNVAIAEALEGITLLLASVVLFFVSYWLISKAEADKWQRYIQGKVKGALARGSGLALAGAAFLAVYREGVETVLFYNALLASPGAETGAVVSGIGIGLIGLAILCVVFNRFGRRVPLRQFFLGTSILLYYLAFVFAGRGIAELQQIGWVGITPVPGMPRIDLLGLYPTLETLAAQGLLLVLLVYAIVVTLRQRAAVATPTEPAARTAT